MPAKTQKLSLTSVEDYRSFYKMLNNQEFSWIIISYSVSVGSSFKFIKFYDLADFTNSGFLPLL